jgi:Inner membrane component of T3SS, cytoplasmic domain
MLATKTPAFDSPSRLLGTLSTELKFRIQGGEHHGRLLRIAAAKCTIGSAPGCTLRLRGEDVEPLHCLIVSGRNGTIIRRNSPRTYLNGGPFEDAALQIGDVLRIGSIELLVVVCQQAAEIHQLPRAQVVEETAGHKQEQQRLAEELAAMGEQLLAVQTLLEEARQGFAQKSEGHSQSVNQLREQREARTESLAREEQLQNELREAQQKQSGLETRLREKEVALQQQAEIHSREVLDLQQARSADRDQHEQERAALGVERQQWEDKLAALESELRQQQGELVHRQEERLGQVEQLQLELREAQQKQSGLETRLREKEGALQQQAENHSREVLDLQQARSADRDQREQERAALGVERQQWEDKLAALENELRQQQGELVQRQELSDNTANQLRRLEGLLQETRPQAEEREAQWKVEQQREQEEFSAVRGQLENSIAALTEQLQKKEADLAGVQQENAESTRKLIVTLDGARNELLELQTLRSLEEEERSALRGRLEQQLAELTARLAERDRELAPSDGEPADLYRQTVVFSNSDQKVKQLEESLAATALAQQEERERWQKERSELERRWSDLDAARLELESRHKDSESRYNEMLLRCTQFEAQSGTLQSECSSLQTQYSVLEGRRNELESQAQEAVRRCAELASQLAGQRPNLDQAIAQEATQQAAGEPAAPQAEDLVERWQSEAHKWQLQAEEVSGQLGEAKELCAKLERELADLQGATPAADSSTAEGQNVEESRARLDQQQKELEEARAQLHAEQNRLGGLLAEASSREELVSRLETELREREAAWEASRSEQAGALEERSKFIASQVAQFETEQAAFARQQATLIQQISALEDRVQELTAAAESRAANSPVLTLPAPEIPAASSSSEETPLERPAEPAAEVDSVVNRLAQAGLWKGNDGDSQEGEDLSAEDPAPLKPMYKPPSFLEQASEMARQEEAAGIAEQSPAASVPSEKGATRAISPASSEGDDDSIEQYMSRLLGRVRGEATVATAAPAVREIQPPVTAPPPVIAPATSEAPDLTKGYVPRTYVPEQPERLSQMRELANSAAQSALHTHAMKHQNRATKQKSLVALLSLIGAGSLFVAGSTTGSRIAILGSACFTVLCGVMSVRALLGGFRQMRLKRPGESGDTPAPAENEPATEPR